MADDYADCPQLRHDGTLCDTCRARRNAAGRSDLADEHLARTRKIRRANRRRLGHTPPDPQGSRGDAAPDDDGTDTTGLNPFLTPQRPMVNPPWQLDEGGMRRAASADINERNAERRIARVQGGLPDDPYDAALDAAPYVPDIRDSQACDGDGYLAGLLTREPTPGIERACMDLLRSRHLPAPTPRCGRITAAQQGELDAVDGYKLALGIDSWATNRRVTYR